MNLFNSTNSNSMDSSWLGFSLSNNTNSNSNSNNTTNNNNNNNNNIDHHINLQSPSSSNLCLFEAFSATSAAPPGGVVDGVQLRQQDQGEDAVAVTTAIPSAATSGLSVFSSPKLEDFLGGGTTPTGGAMTLASPQPLQLVGLSNNDGQDIYESELKTIAASFLRGFAAQQKTLADAHKQHNHQHKLVAPAENPTKKSVDTFGQRTSIYRGVTRHRWTGRYEAHLWDNSCRREGQSRKGRQVYLGMLQSHHAISSEAFYQIWSLYNKLKCGYDKEEKAARAYDLAALKYWGPTTTTNFPVSNYEKELEEMQNMTRQEFVASLRRKSSGFSRGASIYRGVTRHHQHGRWQARIGRVAGNKDLYLGTFSTQEEAAEAYDIAAIKFRGLNAVTNFDMSRYDVKSIANSNLPIGGVSGKSKNSSDQSANNNSDHSNKSDDHRDTSSTSSSNLNFAIPMKQQDPSSDYWSSVILGYQNNSNNNNGKSTVGGLFNQPSQAQSFSMDFSSSSAGNNINGLLFNGGYVQQQQQQQQQSCVSTHTTTNSVTAGNNNPTSTSVSSSMTFGHNNSSSNGGTGTSFDQISASSNGYGSWITPSLHTFQTAKPSLSVFQTPIFGME